MILIWFVKQGGGQRSWILTLVPCMVRTQKLSALSYVALQLLNGQDYSFAYMIIKKTHQQC